MDGVVFGTLLSRVMLGQVSISRSAIGFSDSRPVTRCIDSYGSHQVPGKINCFFIVSGRG